MLTGIKSCSRCSLGFYPYHGNQTLCGSCRAGRRAAGRSWQKKSFGLRHCDRCWREYEAIAENQRYCSWCRRLARQHSDAKYARPEHRGLRRRLSPVVSSGLVRCARGAACKRREMVDGQFVGGFIRPGERWHLGHADGESVGGPEHVACNTGAPSRLRARR